MKLWLLREKKGAPYKGEIATLCAVLIRAETEQDARAEANAVAVNYRSRDVGEYPEYWLNPEWVGCEEVTADGPPKVLIVDFNYA